MYFVGVTKNSNCRAIIDNQCANTNSGVIVDKYARSVSGSIGISWIRYITQCLIVFVVIQRVERKAAVYG